MLRSGEEQLLELGADLVELCACVVCPSDRGRPSVTSSTRSTGLGPMTTILARGVASWISSAFLPDEEGLSIPRSLVRSSTAHRQDTQSRACGAAGALRQAEAHQSRRGLREGA